ncbi:MAG TPA: hypothetical protein VH724_05905, partial [Candidatus Angelobacter sp.]|nr:hypothetical protein [Candidatus Angelobacter sp.]
MKRVLTVSMVTAVSEETDAAQVMSRDISRERRGNWIVGPPRWMGIVLVSVALLVPCFWHLHIGAGDLRSHVYNAWLVQLIERGQAPGLWIAHVWNNVLFDYLLSALGRYFSLPVAGRIGAGIAVLVFFWGSFAFVSAVAGHSAWSIAPLLAAVSYGWTFQQGLLNYFLALGLAFAGLALFLRRSVWRWAALAIFVPAAFLAHPLGAAWFLGAAVYLGIANVTPRRFHAVLVCTAIALLFVGRLYLHSHYRVEGPLTSALFNLMFYNGLDQLVFTKRYVLPVAILAAFIAIVIAGEIIQSKSVQRLLAETALPLGLCVVVQAGILLLPNSIWLPQYPAAISALTTRGTSVSAVLLCALLGAIRPRKWHYPVLTGISAIFFLLLYQDTGALSRFEAQAERLVRSIPAGQRVIATIGGPSDYRFSLNHLADVSCVGH